MKYSHTFKTAISSLGVNRLRSLLTILGIIIGITAIIVVMSIGEGARGLILSQLQGLGSRTLFIAPGKDTQGPGFSMLFVDSLKDRELQAIKKKSNVPTLQDITPLLMIPGSISYNSKLFQPTTVGSAPELQEILDMQIAEGIFINNDDILQKTLTMVIGSNVVNELFGDSPAIGEKIIFKQKKFRVIGILRQKGRVGLFNVDDMVIVPYTTAQNQLLGKKHYDEFIARAQSENEVERTVFDIAATLRELHNITNPEDDDFHIHTQADIAARVGMITGILTILLVSVAGISLLVGGIGVMNIMLVSVTERTSEIGLRKALGARNKDILLQFLFETIILTAVGGATGIFLGAFISASSAFVLQTFFHLAWSFSFPIQGAIIGISVSLAIGLIFGLYPARNAAAKSPLEALRYE